MGVMNCSRSGCESIMCDTYVDDVGYVCGGCKYEFQEYLEGQDKVNITKGEMRRELNKFMETLKGDCDNEIISVSDFFNS